jgi:23S rRNA pseudouridine2605 synthase
MLPEGKSVRRATPRPGHRVQLHRALSKLGLCSRGQAWTWIRAGRVRVDGTVVTDPLTWVEPGRQAIACDGAAVERPAAVTLALHKPKGVVTTRDDERGRRTVYDLLPTNLPWVHPAGRLDADSEGLLILTSDADISTRLTDPVHHVPKTYHVVVRGAVTADSVKRLRDGVDLNDGRTRPACVRIVETNDEETCLEIILTEGKNRQIRRMLAACGHRVRRLIRVAIGEFALGTLRPGETRLLPRDDLRQLLGG